MCALWQKPSEHFHTMGGRSGVFDHVAPSQGNGSEADRSTDSVTLAFNKFAIQAKSALDNFLTKAHEATGGAIGIPAKVRYGPLRPLDLVLFHGNDPVSKWIQNIEKEKIAPSLRSPFAELWSHVGIIVDRSILDLECLEPGKLYVYESVFTGTIAGYVSTKTMPVDHPEALEKGCHAGPQIREFEKVIWEYDGDIGICPLIESEYQRITDSIHESRSKIGAFHQKYSTFSYPFSALPQLSAVDEEIAKVWKVLHSALVKQDTAVFCSEMAALLYSELSVVGFEADTAHTSTPLAQQVAPCFGGVCYFVKSSGRSFLWPDGKTIPLRQAKPRSASSNTSK